MMLYWTLALYISSIMKDEGVTDFHCLTVILDYFNFAIRNHCFFEDTHLGVLRDNTGTQQTEQ